MIPKVIHYCWFGGNPLPELAIKCINSWNKYLPGYEIREWNESNFDVNSIKYTQQAYKRKKYAFVSDYARFWILYHYGGIYFDIDVELIKPFEPILQSGPYMGLETNNVMQTGIFTGTDVGVACNPGLGMATVKGMKFCKDMLDLYQDLSFIFPSGAINTKSVVSYTSEMLLKCGYDKRFNGIQECAGFKIYPREYFCPRIDRETGKITLYPETHSIHHYAATWVDKKMMWKERIVAVMIKVLPISAVKNIRKIYRIILRKNNLYI